MNRFHIPGPVIAAFLALFCLPDAKAERVPNHLRDAMWACIDRADEALRLACYDRKTAEPISISANMPAHSQAPDVAQVAQRSAEDAFGLKDEASSGVPGNKEMMQLTATVVSFTVVAGKLTVSLDNGQVWRQKYTGSYQIRVGDRVTIKKGRWGGYSYFRRGHRIVVRRIR